MRGYRNIAAVCCKMFPERENAQFSAKYTSLPIKVRPKFIFSVGEAAAISMASESHLEARERRVYRGVSSAENLRG